MGEKRRQEAQAATKRADDLVAELIEMTSELVEMSKRMAEQTAAMDKMRTDFEDFGHGRGGGNTRQDSESRYALYSKLFRARASAIKYAEAAHRSVDPVRSKN